VSSVAELLEQGKAHQRAGRLRDAEPLYEQAAGADPANFEAHYLLGTTLHGLGKAKEALTSLEEAARLGPQHAPIHHHLAVVLAQLGRLDEAIASYRRTLELAPNDARALNNLGAALMGQNKPAEAMSCYRRALELKPDNPEAHNNLANVFEKQGNLAEASTHYWQALALKPDFAEAHNNLGVILERQQNFVDALSCFRQALELRPDFVEALNNVGTTLSKQGKLEEATGCFRRAFELKPDFLDARKNLGMVLTRQGKLDEATDCYLQALELQPDYAEAHNNLGTVSFQQDKLTKAVTSYRRALKLRPDYAEAHKNLGVALLNQAKLDQAIESFERAWELEPDYVDAHLGHATALLLMGRFAEGWAEYEWRWKNVQVPRYRDKPRWTGLGMPDATILLHSEQGLGDALQFIRYAEMVKERVGTVVVECQPQLTTLFSRCTGVDRVVAEGETLPEFDVQMPLLSLPGVFGTSPDSVPAKVPYLWPEERFVEKWKDELSEERGFKIGIAWAGRPENLLDRTRSIPLTHFAGIAATAGVRLYSLQMGAGHEQLSEFEGRWPITDLAARLGEFHNTAAIVRNLDLVITCDSAPAHLAGALGVPVWVALPHAPDWRWMLEREDSPWYPTMRLFRQTRRGEWSGVFKRIEQALAEKV
jgi:Flp pilus assembly protein TadD